ncbi:transcriptional regulator, AraC family protein [Pedobacter sp. BAL39]|uniref:helix-turn-helix transcriptional regulator n=1 Tax=Pedobacter sp. BAL39 TaxID=391596 RepID=UPI000155A10C|nr:AraC family transcriptional regulator [Pedobacter sp. BAL39]EDM36603.1 transcriptional regulator, AraC family protein [Pedobacter sp. BAL39]
MKSSCILVDKNEILVEYASAARRQEPGDKYEINVTYSGSVDYLLSKRQLTLYPETFIFLNPGTPYTRTIDATLPVDSLSLRFDPEFCQDFERVLRMKQHQLLDNPEGGAGLPKTFADGIYPLQGDLRYTLRHLKKHISAGNLHPLLLGEYLNHCLLNCYGMYDTEIRDRADALGFLAGSTRDEILRRLSIAKDYIISNYNKDICLEDIAHAACLSVNHFMRTFKQAYRQSPHQFLTSVRLKQAKFLLKNTDYPVNEIVDIVGFECASSFIRLFRNSFKVTPGQYR